MLLWTPILKNDIVLENFIPTFLVALVMRWLV